MAHSPYLLIHPPQQIIIIIIILIQLLDKRVLLNHSMLFFKQKKTASLVSPLGITQTGSTFAPIMSSTSSPSSNVKHLPNLNVSNSNNISNIEAIADHPETLESALTYIEELTHRLITLEDKHEKLQLFVQNIYERLNQ